MRFRDRSVCAHCTSFANWSRVTFASFVLFPHVAAYRANRMMKNQGSALPASGRSVLVYTITLTVQAHFAKIGTLASFLTGKTRRKQRKMDICCGILAQTALLLDILFSKVRDTTPYFLSSSGLR
jgi:hypothetical protein